MNESHIPPPTVTPGNESVCASVPSLSPLRHPLQFLGSNWGEITKFLTVGFANYFVDLSLYNLARLTLLPGMPMWSKIFSVAGATVFSWVVNRSWTFRGKSTRKLGIEAVLFAVINVIGMLPALLCLWVSHYLLGLTSLLADNISANVVGLVLGTILRYFAYKFILFTKD